MFLSIIIPVFNEENTILDVIDLLEKTNFPPIINNWEVVVVDDCSTDKTYEKVKNYIQGNPNYSLFRNEKNTGKGASVKYGILHSKGDTILIQDADLELIPSDIPSLVNAMITTKVQFINGSRYLPGVSRPLFAYTRYLANKLFTFFTSLVINVKLTDMACAYKLFTRELYSQLNLNEKGFGFEAELIIKAMRIRKNNIAEVPVHYFPRNKGEGKKLKWLDGIVILWVIVKYGLLRIK